MAGDLSSFIEIRKAHNQYNEYNECLLLADSTGYLHRQNVERYEAKVDFNDLRQSRYLLKEFDEMWDTVAQNPNLRWMTL